jgi:hypothetical protein
MTFFIAVTLRIRRKTGADVGNDRFAATTGQLRNHHLLKKTETRGN